MTRFTSALSKFFAALLLVASLGSAQAQNFNGGIFNGGGGGGGGTPASPSGSIQYNNAGAFGAVPSFTNASSIFALGNTATAQQLIVYNTVDTISSPTNYERGVFDWTTTSNVLTIGTQAGGTGTVRAINLVAGPIATSWYFNIANNGISIFNQGGGQIVTQWFGGNFTLASGMTLGWNPNGSISGSNDSSISRVTAKVLQFGDGGANTNGWMQWSGETRATGDVTNTSTTTLATVTGLSVALQAGRTYSFDVYLSFTDAAAGGIQAAMVATGGLTATAIEYDGWIVDSGSNGIKGNAQAAALGGVVASSTTTGTAGVVQIKGTITVNVAGTLNVQTAQNTSNATATTIKRGSRMILHDMP